MARRTHLVTLMFQPRRMWIVAIRTANSLVVHLALDERAVDIHFVQNLAVGIISVGKQKFVGEVVIKVFARPISRLYNATT